MQAKIYLSCLKFKIILLSLTKKLRNCPKLVTSQLTLGSTRQRYWLELTEANSLWLGLWEIILKLKGILEMCLPPSLLGILPLTCPYQQSVSFQRGSLLVRAEGTSRFGWRKKRGKRISKMSIQVTSLANGKWVSNVLPKWSVLQCAHYNSKSPLPLIIALLQPHRCKVYWRRRSSKEPRRSLRGISWIICTTDFTKAKSTQWISVFKDQYLPPSLARKIWSVFGITKSLIANLLKYLTVKATGSSNSVLNL